MGRLNLRVLPNSAPKLSLRKWAPIAHRRQLGLLWKSGSQWTLRWREMDSNVRFRAFFSLRISSIFLIPRSRSAEGSDAEFGTEPSPSSGKSRADSRCTRSKRVAFLCTSPGPGNVSPISSPCWMSHCDEGRHLYNIDRHRSLASLYGGHDPGVCALQTGALSEWLLGYPDKALASINGAVNLAERLGHPFSLAFALLYQAVLYLFRREPEAALRHAHEVEAFAVEQRLALLLDPNILRGKAFLAQEAVENALASVREVSLRGGNRLGFASPLPPGYRVRGARRCGGLRERRGSTG